MLASLFIFLMVALLLKRAYLTPLRKVPGPWYAAFTNLVLKWHVLTGRRSVYIHGLHQNYGSYVRITPQEVSVADIDGFKAIYKMGTAYKKSTWYEDFTDARASPGMFAMIGAKQHSARRRLFSQPCSNSSVLRFEAVIRAKVVTAVSKIARDARIGCADLLKWYTFMAADVIAELSFGKSFGMLEKEERTQYIRDIEATFMILGLRTELPWLWNLIRLLPFRAIRKLTGARDRISLYGATAVQRQKADLTSTGGSSGPTATFFSSFLDPSKQRTELSEFEVASEAGNFIVAGSDTTGASAMWLTWALLHPRNQEVRRKLDHEIASLPPDAPAQSILALPYLEERCYRDYAAVRRYLEPSEDCAGWRCRARWLLLPSWDNDQFAVFHTASESRRLRRS